MEVRVPCSPDQLDVIEAYLLEGAELGMQPDERAWIIASVRKTNPGARIKSADLDIAEGEWLVQLQE